MTSHKRIDASANPYRHTCMLSACHMSWVWILHEAATLILLSSVVLHCLSALLSRIKLPLCGRSLVNDTIHSYSNAVHINEKHPLSTPEEQDKRWKHILHNKMNGKCRNARSMLKKQDHWTFHFLLFGHDHPFTIYFDVNNRACELGVVAIVFVIRMLRKP